MAKMSRSFSMKNAEIRLDKGVIVETTKDGESIFSIKELLKEWDKISGISISFKKDEEVFNS